MTEKEREREGGSEAAGSQASMATAATGTGRFHVVEPQLNVFFQLIFRLAPTLCLLLFGFSWDILISALVVLNIAGNKSQAARLNKFLIASNCLLAAAADGVCCLCQTQKVVH